LRYKVSAKSKGRINMPDATQNDELQNRIDELRTKIASLEALKNDLQSRRQVVEETEVSPITEMLGEETVPHREFLRQELEHVRNSLVRPLDERIVSTKTEIEDARTSIGNLERQRELQKKEAKDQAAAERIHALFWRFAEGEDLERKDEMADEILAALNQTGDECSRFIRWNEIDRIGVAVVLLGRHPYVELLRNPEELTNNLRRINYLNGEDNDPRLSAEDRRKLGLCWRYAAHTDPTPEEEDGVDVFA